MNISSNFAQNYYPVQQVLYAKRINRYAERIMAVKIRMRDVFDFRVVPDPKHIVPSIQATGAGAPNVFEHEKPADCK